MEDLQNVIDRFFEFRQKGKNHRYESWEHCYSQFQNHLKRDKLSENEADYLALHLAFYLASWGMYRGSSFLLQRDYKVLVPIVRLLIEKGLQFKDENVMSVIESCSIDDVSSYVDAYFEIDSLLLNELKAIRIDVKGKVVNEVSYTLRTKILLGTLGCIPAYDRFFKEGIKLSENKTLIQSYSKNGLKKLIQFSKNNLKQLKEAQKSINNMGFENGYPIMKIMDMYFFQIGLDKDIGDKAI